MPEDNRPTHLAIVFDKSEITFRKQNIRLQGTPRRRRRRPHPQFALIREAVRADLPCLEQVGFRPTI
jgi:DNA polymerase-1